MPDPVPPSPVVSAAPAAAPETSRRGAFTPIPLDDLDRAILARLQGDFPLSEAPFADAAAALGCAEATLIARIERLLEARVLTRFGPLFQVERMGGAFVLAALAVPEERYEAVAEAVNALPEVAHNYRREHALNMWFVLATETPDGIPRAIAAIEAATGLPVFAFPKEEEFFVEMKLEARV
ncbi:Lrp/AsnC family transcriptional regulator [Oryzomicrobium sp.]|uniref:Lrp/AsnC family transcriptional regulator n=1 Tax=Oryzomicrobium sp. TaxID=1911578 RepID=UPI002FE3A433